MINENIIQEILDQLTKDQRLKLKDLLKNLVGNDNLRTVDYDVKVRNKVSHIILDFCNQNIPKDVEKILFKHNIGIKKNENTNQNLIEVNVALAEEERYKQQSHVDEQMLTTIESTNERPLFEVAATIDQDKNQGDQTHKNLNLDGRGEFLKKTERFFQKFSEEEYEIIVKIILCISVFGGILLLIMGYLNGNAIEDVKTYYLNNNLNFLYSYASQCNIDANIAKTNKCVISLIEEKLNQLSSKRAYNYFFSVLFFLTAIVFFYQYINFRPKNPNK